jgi:hypothetical protein
VLSGKFDLTSHRVGWGKNCYIEIGTGGIFGIMLGGVHYREILVLTLTCGFGLC